jgi:hypothetical protein
VSFTPNAGAGRELLSTPEAMAAVKADADTVAQRAADIMAGIGEGTEAAYYYAGDPYIDPATGTARCDAGSTSSIWHIIEYGSVNNPAYRPLTTAVESLGIEYDPEAAP